MKRQLTTDRIEKIIDKYKARAKTIYLASENLVRQVSLLDGYDKETRTKRRLLSREVLRKLREAKRCEHKANVYRRRLAALRIVLHPYTAP